jgi:hypothetical protein
MDTALPFAAVLTVAVAMVSGAALRAWRQWLDLRRAEIAASGAGRSPDLLELRRRVRRIEALASGIDL